MAKVDVIMPQMGESVMEGTVIEWTKQIGDIVEVDETLLEIATDKVDSEVPSPEAGVLVEILVEEGETIEVGKPIARIVTDAGTVSESITANPITDPEPAPTPSETVNAATTKTQQSDSQTISANTASQGNMETVDVVMPQMGESVVEATVIGWMKKVGDTVEEDETILEISTDKVDSEVPSPVKGILMEIRAEADDTIEVGQVIAVIGLVDGVSTGSPMSTTSADIGLSLIHI